MLNRNLDLGVDAEFEQFFADHHPSITRALALTLGSVEHGQDAAAESFARALDRWNDVQSYENPRGWLYRVGVNWARSRRRRQRREVHQEDWKTLRRQAAVGDESEHVDNDLLVTEALAQLSVDHRIVIVGRFFLDWKETDLAEALEVPLGTIKSRTTRALSQLANILENES